MSLSKMYMLYNILQHFSACPTFLVVKFTLVKTVIDNDILYGEKKQNQNLQRPCNINIMSWNDQNKNEKILM